MKRRLWLGLILSFAAVGWFRWKNSFLLPERDGIEKANLKATAPKLLSPKMAAVSPQVPKHLPAAERKPSSQKKTHPALPEGFSLAENVYVSNGFDGTQGELIEQSAGLFFIRSSSRPEGSIQAAEDKYGRYYAINKTVKLSGISEQKRQELIQLGLVEQYYHAGLGVFYAEAPEDPLAFYDELKDKGLSPTLELNRNFHQKR